MLDNKVVIEVFMSKKLNEQGFSVSYIIIGIFLLAIFLGGFFYLKQRSEVAKNQKTQTTSNDQSSQPSSNESEDATTPDTTASENIDTTDSSSVATNAELPHTGGIADTLIMSTILGFASYFGVYFLCNNKRNKVSL
jgi:cytoskeletal protein RodZ